jgi:hypothetical protein
MPVCCLLMSRIHIRERMNIIDCEVVQSCDVTRGFHKWGKDSLLGAPLKSTTRIPTTTTKHENKRKALTVNNIPFYYDFS